MFERDYRDLAHVPRWGIVPVIKRQSVAEHSYYVTLYMSHICYKLDLECAILVKCLRHGLEHDRGECYTSDIPGPVKRSIVDKQSELYYEAKEDVRRFGIEKFDTDKVVVAIRKMADLMDEYAYWQEEYMLGNRRATQFLEIISPALHTASELVGELTKNEGPTMAIMEDFKRKSLADKVVPEDPRDELAA